MNELTTGVWQPMKSSPKILQSSRHFYWVREVCCSPFTALVQSWVSFCWRSSLLPGFLPCDCETVRLSLVNACTDSSKMQCQPSCDTQRHPIVVAPEYSSAIFSVTVASPSVLLSFTTTQYVHSVLLPVSHCSYWSSWRSNHWHGFLDSKMDIIGFQIIHINAKQS